MLNIIIRKSISVPAITTLIAFSPEIALAAESSTSSLLPPFWPLIALFIIVIVFRRQLNYDPAFEQREEPSQFEEPTPLEELVQPTQEKISIEPETPNIEAEIDIEVNNNLIDITIPPPNV